MFTYPSYLRILQDQLLCVCFEFFPKAVQQQHFFFSPWRAASVPSYKCSGLCLGEDCRCPILGFIIVTNVLTNCWWPVKEFPLPNYPVASPFCLLGLASFTCTSYGLLPYSVKEHYYFDFWCNIGANLLILLFLSCVLCIFSRLRLLHAASPPSRPPHERNLFPPVQHSIIVLSSGSEGCWILVLLD